MEQQGRRVTDAELREIVAESDWCSIRPGNIATKLLSLRAERKRLRAEMRHAVGLIFYKNYQEAHDQLKAALTAPARRKAKR